MLKIESELEKQELAKIINKYIHECPNSELAGVLEIVRGEIDSRIAHIEENWEKYWDKEEDSNAV